MAIAHPGRSWPALAASLLLVAGSAQAQSTFSPGFKVAPTPRPKSYFPAPKPYTPPPRRPSGIPPSPNPGKAKSVYGRCGTTVFVGPC